MRKIGLFIIAFFIILYPFTVVAQDCDCYTSTRAKGVQLMQQKQYSRAIEYFNAAEDCPDKPASNDLKAKRDECLLEIRRIDEERQRQRELEEETARQREKDAFNAKKGYMQIKDIVFANADYDNNILSPYGSKLISSKMRYLKPKIIYNGLSSGNKSITLFWKIINPDGTVKNNSTSPDGYTSSGTYTIQSGTDKELYPFGWGNKNGGAYTAGTYRYELWYNGNKIHSKSITIYDSRDATIEEINVDHGVYQNNAKGMKIHVKFTISGCKGESCRCIAYFYENGKEMRDTNNSYQTSDGQVALGDDFHPGYENTKYDDFVMFMPMSELHTKSTIGEIPCYFSVQIYNIDTKSFIGNEKKYYFTITK